MNIRISDNATGILEYPARRRRFRFDHFLQAPGSSFEVNGRLGSDQTLLGDGGDHQRHRLDVPDSRPANEHSREPPRSTPGETTKRLRQSDEGASAGRGIVGMLALRAVAAAGLLAGTVMCLAACGGSAPLPGSGSREPVAARGSAAQPDTVVSDSVRVLAYGALPNGQGFWISARRYALAGRASVDLTADLVPTAVQRAASNGGFASAGDGTFTPGHVPGPLALGGLVACVGRPVTLLLGLLRARSDTAVLSYGGRSYAMARVAIPHDLRTGGDLVYGYANEPVRVVLRSASRRIVETAGIPGAQRGSPCTPGPPSSVRSNLLAVVSWR
jgi:hypothetical protein